MQISKNTVVTFHYVLREEGGDILEHSQDDEPTVYLHGHHALIPGLENAMTDKSSEDEFTITLSPKEGFGVRQEGAQQRVPIKHLLDNKKLKPGKIVAVRTAEGPRQAVVVKVGKFNVDLDTNHPYAGKTVSFDIRIVDVREATQEEIAHGHAHGPGGHEH